MYTDVKYAQMMCEYVCTSCLKVLWQETLRRSLLESGRSSEICWLSKIWGVTASEAAISVKRKPNKILCTGSSLLLREPFLRFYSPVLLSHCEDKIWSSSLGRPQGKTSWIVFWIWWVGLYPLLLGAHILLCSWWLGQLKLKASPETIYWEMKVLNEGSGR